MILGIDLGQKTTGLAISEGQLASPYLTIKHKSSKEMLSQIVGICDKLKIQKVVIGFVEGKIKKFFEKFAEDLENKRPKLKVILWDETLTSRQARETMINMGIARKKRRKKEHLMSAAIILQSYLDSQ